MKSTTHELKLLLIKESFSYKEENNSLIIELPNGFGKMYVSDLDKSDDIIGLVGEDWHTHSSCLENEELSPAKKIMEFIKDIYSGRYLLIEEKEPYKESIKRIEYDLESYQKYLPESTAYKIYNQT